MRKIPPYALSSGWAHYGNGNTEGICSSIFPVSPSFDPSSLLDEVEQSTDEVWRLQPVDPCAAKPDITIKFPSKMRSRTKTNA
jgi:hypothetical protein